MILLVGASGRLGRAVAERLLRDGVPFRAGVRTPHKAEWLVTRGVEVTQLDVATGAGLRAALVGATTVVSAIHGLLGRSRQSIARVDVAGQAALIDAARAARVGRFVYLSAHGACEDHPSEFWRAKAGAERHLKASELNHVIVRPSAFMDLYAHDMIGSAVLAGRPVIVLGDGATPRNMIAVDDVAAASVQAATRDDLLGETIEVGGRDEPTEREVAALYAEIAGKPAKVRAIPPGVLRALSTVAAPLHAGVGHLLRLPLQMAGRRDLRLDASATMQRLGIEPVRLRAYVEQRVAAAAL